MKPSIRFLACLLLAGGTPAQASVLLAPLAGDAATLHRSGYVWVVDAAGAGDFAAIQPAVDAAADGDWLLVRAGSYAAFTLDGRSLGIAADAGAQVQVAGGACVRNLAPRAQVLLLGLSLYANPAAPGGASQGLLAQDDLGSLHVEAC